ncbi:hypothetical protein Psi01_56340 [Planobispora siamensis]|uniref:DUF4352 domain-containing protein n=1 Tax=Planobispora siamensis TaxID=936338 RepID=A0A8J3SMF1_9ACTN|nr:hypothetical protein Psi01_56340 [Planobispora siamensis]
MIAVIITVLTGGCSGEPQQAARTPAATPSPTYDLPARAVRPGEIAVTAPPAQDGEIRFQVIGLQKGLSGFFGSHAEWQAKGQYVVVRILMENPGRTNSRFEAGKQRLVAADGTAHAIDPFTQATKRQPDRFLLGAGVRVEMDLWFDIPKDARPASVKLFGDPPLGLAATDGVTVPLP